MSRLQEWLTSIEEQGYRGANARARLCQDIVLEAISKGKLSRHVTIKGGVVMRSLTGDIRRATQNMDIDFIRYSLADEAIRRFIDDINVFEDFHIELVGTIEPLKHQDYHGKSITIRISDDTGMTIDSKLHAQTSTLWTLCAALARNQPISLRLQLDFLGFHSKIDLGVHKDLTIQQEEYCFDVCMDDEGASLLINSREQMLTEKLRSLLKFGPLSTRFKDIFDICYLVDHVDRQTLDDCMNHYIFSDEGMRENNYPEIVKRLQGTFSNRRYQSRIKTSRKNWLEISEQDAFQKILGFFMEC